MSEPRIINTYDQLVAAGGGIAIITNRLPGRDNSPYGWAVFRVVVTNIANATVSTPVATDLKAAWYDGGCKVFPYRRNLGTFAGKAAALEDAKRWITETYDEPGPWKRNAMRDYVPERIQKQFPIRRSKP